MGEAGEGQNITHQQKKMGETSLREFRDRFQLEISDEKLAEVPFVRFAEDSPELKYLRSVAQLSAAAYRLGEENPNRSRCRRFGVRRPAQGYWRPDDFDDDGLCPRVEHALAR